MKKKRKLKLVGFDHAKGALENFSSPALFFVAIAMLVGALWLIVVTHSLSIGLSVAIGGVVSAILMFFLPPNPFTGGFWGTRRKGIAELDVSERRVLSFFKGKFSKMITCICFLFYAIAICVAGISGHHLRSQAIELSTEAALVFSMGSGILSLVSFFTINICVLYWIVLNNWKKIQQSCQTWPENRPYVEVATFTSPQK